VKYLLIIDSLKGNRIIRARVGLHNSPFYFEYNKNIRYYKYRDSFFQNNQRNIGRTLKIDDNNSIENDWLSMIICDFNSRQRSYFKWLIELKKSSDSLAINKTDYSINYHYQKNQIEYLYLPKIENYPNSFEAGSANLVNYNSDSAFMEHRNETTSFKKVDTAKVVKLSQKFRLIYYFYLSCAPCRLASKAISSFYSNCKIDSLNVLGVDPFDRQLEVDKYKFNGHLEFDLIADDSFNIRIQEDLIEEYPTVVLYDANWRRLKTWVGIVEIEEISCHEIFNILNKFK
jgi:hypothetical protein